MPPSSEALQRPSTPSLVSLMSTLKCFATPTSTILHLSKFFLLLHLHRTRSETAEAAKDRKSSNISLYSATLERHLADTTQHVRRNYLHFVDILYFRVLHIRTSYTFTSVRLHTRIRMPFALAYTHTIIHTYIP